MIIAMGNSNYDEEMMIYDERRLSEVTDDLMESYLLNDRLRFG